MATQVYDLPNRDLMKLCLIQESAEDLAPVLRAVKAAKTRLDAQYAAGAFVAGLAEHTSVGAALTPAVTWPAAPTTGTAFGNYATIVAAIADPVLKANLQKVNGDGYAEYDQTHEFPMNAIGSVVDWLNSLNAPKLTDPIAVDDNGYADTVMLFSGYQFVLNAYATLFTQRGLSVPA